jgi:hypothetical protein
MEGDIGAGEQTVSSRLVIGVTSLPLGSPVKWSYFRSDALIQLTTKEFF